MPVTRARIRKLAAFSVMRGSGYALLGIVMAMSGMAFEPALAFRAGAIMMLLLALVLQFKAMTYHTLRRVKETEVWMLLPDDDRPPVDEARPMIVAAMSAELHEKALWAVVVAAAFLATAIVIRVFTAPAGL